jgi:predicted metal-binding membrane protein
MVTAWRIPALRAGLLVPAAVAIALAWLLLAATADHGSVASFGLMWSAMALAMMLPTATRPLLKAAEGSARRGWVFTAGFLGVWIAAGPLAYAAMTAIAWTPFWIALAWVAAGTYQVTPQVQRLMRSCSSVGYDGRPGRYGLRQGLRCVASCAPVMLAAMVTAMALPSLVAPVLVMVALTVLLCWEKRPTTSQRALTAVGMAMIVVAVIGVMVLGGGPGHAHLG